MSAEMERRLAAVEQTLKEDRPVRDENNRMLREMYDTLCGKPLKGEAGMVGIQQKHTETLLSHEHMIIEANERIDSLVEEVRVIKAAPASAAVDEKNEHRRLMKTAAYGGGGALLVEIIKAVGAAVLTLKGGK